MGPGHANGVSFQGDRKDRPYISWDCQVGYLLTSKPRAVTAASPRQNQPGVGWRSNVSIMPPAISARNSITQEKLPMPEALLSLPLSLPLRRPRRRDLPLRG